MSEDKVTRLALGTQKPGTNESIKAHLMDIVDHVDKGNTVGVVAVALDADGTYTTWQVTRGALNGLAMMGALQSVVSHNSLPDEQTADE